MTLQKDFESHCVQPVEDTDTRHSLRPGSAASGGIACPPSLRGPRPACVNTTGVGRFRQQENAGDH